MVNPLPPQHQHQQPGKESEMEPRPEALKADQKSSGKLQGKVAVITGGDSGIGRAVAYLFAKEGANLILSYLDEEKDAKETQQEIEKIGQKCILIAGDIGEESHCEKIIQETQKAFSSIDILINNAAEQHVRKLEEISAEQLERTFRTNIFSYFYMAKHALSFLKAGASIINTTSVVAYKGSPVLLDYAATKGAIVAFTRSLAMLLAEKKIRVNAVAPGPIWTPLIPASFSEEQVSEFGQDVPLGRPGQPAEIAPCYLFLASEDASYITGQVLHPNGGTIVNG